MKDFWQKVREAYKNRANILRAILYFFRDNIFLLFGVQTESLSLYVARVKICNTCPHKSYFKGCVLPVGACCSICGCNLRLKLRLKDQHCPIYKW